MKWVRNVRVDYRNRLLNFYSVQYTQTSLKAKPIKARSHFEKTYKSSGAKRKRHISDHEKSDVEISLSYHFSFLFIFKI
jgi:hypothetical protein